MTSRLVFASICPHPPILIPKIGKDNLENVLKTLASLQELGKKFKEEKPDTVILVSPHAPFSSSSFSIFQARKFYGDFGMFGDFGDSLSFDSDSSLAGYLVKRIKKEKMPINLISYPELDHGALVPLYYLTKELEDVKLVLMSFSGLDLSTHFKFGRELGKLLASNDKKSKKVACVASGDLSHRLTPSAPAGYSERGREFDEKLVELLKKNDVKEILNLDPILAEEAGECGLRSIVILLGVLSNFKYKPEVLSYEGPFGVGYLTCDFQIKKK
ncbi:extradiol ring-cleavage dioxygenase [bacterium (Candidatus Torokbacteria) CG_4_10_14_0_2_um_filter_35_8]|nr:MAG: extradiol ring-cleavage dioxygenase [bacterium (Candidatus Torokbacteria) CG_4_10_14_0_2_um_filter_35_8]